MKPPSLWGRWILCGLLFSLSVLTPACGPKDKGLVQGYVEGEFVYVASPMAGALQQLAVERGTLVKAGDALFTLEDGFEKAVWKEAERKVAQAKANLEDARQGQRPTELQAMQAQLDQARAALTLSTTEFERQIKLGGTGVASRQEVDRSRSTRDQDQQRVSQLEAALETAQLGTRAQQIVAAEAALRAQEAALAGTEWSLLQKRQNSPKAGLIFDTLYREGDWVGAGKPVVVLLPPSNIKARVFVSQERLGLLHPGDSASLFVDGVKDAFRGRVSYISPKAEYTPPVIYSQEVREKLVFMVEISFDPDVAAKLHPGQPVDVQFAS